MRFKFITLLKLIFLIYLTTVSSQLFAQCGNLVPNGGFESFSALPNANCDWSLAVGWNNAATSSNCNTTNGTPDYYHLQGQGIYSSLPSNYFAVVNPFEGSAVMGLTGNITLFPTFREYIATTFSSPLVVGQSYTLKYSITAGTPNVAGLYVDGWGASLSVGPILQTPGTSDFIPATSQSFNVPGVFNSQQWQTFTFTFVANQAYDHFTFGNFFSPDNQTVVPFGTQGNVGGAYIFIDGVSITPLAPQPLAVGVPNFNICPGDSAQVNAQVTGGLAPYSYTWRPNIASTFNPIQLNPSQTTAYTVKVTDCIGDTATTTFNVVVNAVSSIDVRSACNSFTWIDGITYSASTNTPTFTLQSAAGCDSIVTLNLTVNNSTSGTDTRSACGTFTWINGVTYTASTNTPTFAISQQSGCDSILTLNLTINNEINTTDIQTKCSSYTWIDGRTYTSSTNTPTFTLPGPSGCDSIVKLNLTIIGPKTGLRSFTVCEGEAVSDAGKEFTTAGTFETRLIATSTGCDSLHTTEVKYIIIPLETRQIPEGKVQNGQQVDLIALATGQNLAYSWEPKDMVTCQSCPITKTNPVSKTTTFKVQVRDTVFNCFTEKEIIVQTNCVIEIPNFLTPNNDNFNDFLFLKQNECIVNVSSLRVFNRWGKEVHFVENLPNIQETELWRPEQTGVYYYQMEVNTTEGGKNKFHGWIQVTK